MKLQSLIDIEGYQYRGILEINLQLTAQLIIFDRILAIKLQLICSINKNSKQGSRKEEESAGIWNP